MGILRDALNNGLISLEEYEELEETWSDLGYKAGVFGDVEALQKMTEDLAEFELTDLANEAFELYEEALYYYEGKSGFSIWYDSNVQRWRETDTGRFTYDPYERLRF
jgi:hypothetical protein